MGFKLLYHVGLVNKNGGRGPDHEVQVLIYGTRPSQGSTEPRLEPCDHILGLTHNGGWTHPYTGGSPLVQLPL